MWLRTLAFAQKVEDRLFPARVSVYLQSPVLRFQSLSVDYPSRGLYYTHDMYLTNLRSFGKAILSCLVCCNPNGQT